MTICPRCHGEGWLPPSDVFPDGSYYTSRPCPHCAGQGYVSCCDGPVGCADEEPRDPNQGGRS